MLSYHLPELVGRSTGFLPNECGFESVDLRFCGLALDASDQALGRPFAEVEHWSH